MVSNLGVIGRHEIRFKRLTSGGKRVAIPNQSRAAPESEEAINREYGDFVESVFGEDARSDEQPLRESLGKLPMGGAIVYPDPGDLDPVRYDDDEELSEDDIARAAIEGVRMAYSAPLIDEPEESTE
jgi:hypothetical protein